MAKTKKTKTKKTCKKRVVGGSLINRLIDANPFKLVLPNSEFCGVQNDTRQLLDAGVKPKNKTDTACLRHDLSYLASSDDAVRARADKELLNAALSRITSSDASLGERALASTVAAAMKLKGAIGGGIKKRKARNLLKGGKIKKNKKKGGAFYLKKYKKGGAGFFLKNFQKTKKGTGTLKSR